MMGGRGKPHGMQSDMDPRLGKLSLIVNKMSFVY